MPTNNAESSDDEEAYMTEAMRQTSTAVRRQSNMILALTGNSNTTLNSGSATTMDVNHRHSASTTSTTTATKNDDNDKDDDDDDDDEEAYMTEAMRQTSAAVRQQSNMILELTRTSSINTNAVNSIDNTVEYDDEDDDASELQTNTVGSASVYKQNAKDPDNGNNDEEAAKKKKTKKKKTKKKTSTKKKKKKKTNKEGDSSEKDQEATSSRNADGRAMMSSTPGASRMTGDNEEASGPPPTSSRRRRQSQQRRQQQIQENEEDEENSKPLRTSAASESAATATNAASQVAEAQAFVVEDVAVVAEVISRDELISEVRDQVLEEAGIVSIRRRSNVNGDDDNNKNEIDQERDKWRQVFLTTCIVCGCCVLILVIALTIGFMFRLRGDEGNDDGSNDGGVSTLPPSSTVTNMTSPPQDNTGDTSTPLSEEEAFTRLRERIVPLFVTYASVDEADDTNQKFERPGPVARALTHLANDPSWMDYSDRRLVRRFVFGVLYYSTTQLTTGRNDWINDDNWMDYGVHECRWYGVVTPTISDGCETLPDGIGIGLHLPNNNLHGKIPNQLIFLADTLVSVDFSGNSITEFPPIPPVFITHPNLESLLLRDNQIDGELKIGDANNGCLLPDGCNVFEDSVLTELDLGNNLFSGDLPRALSGLRNLEVLRVDGNADITGTIPSSYCDGMLQLRELTVLDTSIVGEMPRCFCQRGDSFLAEADCSSGEFSCNCCEGFGC